MGAVNKIIKSDLKVIKKRKKDIDYLTLKHISQRALYCADCCMKII